VQAHGSFRTYLLTALGMRKARRLMRDFGGRKVRIPCDTFAHDRARERRNRRIVAALRRETYRAVARQFRVSKATVERVAKSSW
jgi:DNA invertase Pin-like site-specific DNA recombinase